MRIREHFLLGTQEASISVTAKVECGREHLYRYAVESILSRYQEEFGKEKCQEFVAQLASTPREEINWRIRPEESCWNQLKGDAR